MGTVDNVRLVFLFRIIETFSEGINIDNHDLNIRTGGKVSYIGKFAGVIDKIVETDILIKLTKMVHRDLQRLIHPFFNGDGRNNNNELGEAIEPVHFKDRAQIDVGFPGPGLHLHGKIHGVHFFGRSQPIFQLNLADVFVDILIQQLQTVSDTQIVFHAGNNLLGRVLQRCHGKIGLANFLPFKYSGNGFYSLFLEVQIRIELYLHLTSSLHRQCQPV